MVIIETLHTGMTQKYVVNIECIIISQTYRHCTFSSCISWKDSEAPRWARRPHAYPKRDNPPLLESKPSVRAVYTRVTITSRRPFGWYKGADQLFPRWLFTTFTLDRPAHSIPPCTNDRWQGSLPKARDFLATPVPSSSFVWADRHQIPCDTTSFQILGVLRMRYTKRSMNKE